MTVTENMELVEFYDYIQTHGDLRSADHAKKWAKGVLEILGKVLDRKTKRTVAKNLPEEIATYLNGVFWLLHFRNSNYPLSEFSLRVGRRSGNSDSEYAIVPIKAVFGGLRLYLGPDLDQRVSDSLSPELSQLWQESQPVDLTIAG